MLAAVATGAPVIPVYVLDDETPRHRRMGGASRWWLHYSLASLDRALRDKGSRLLLRRGRVDEVLPALAAETGAREVHALHHYEPWWRNAERAVAARLALRLHHGNYLAPPGTLLTGSGAPYRVYTPFWRALVERMPPPPPAPAPVRIPAPAQWPHSDALADWGLLPDKPDWAGGLREEWVPGEAGANARLAAFLAEAASYSEQRNLPSVEGTSRLSPYLHFGEISPATVWHATADAGGSVDTFLGELGWRDYAQNLILQLPDYGVRPGKPLFETFAWRSGDEADADIAAWRQGRTGYPIVDAGMRQLWHTGWMHNRVRMIAASFLIKHLLVDWRVGEQWFWDTLVDADYGSNACNWQWVAGTSVDSTQFTRIMAPLTQSEKFDAAAYIRQWVPELARVRDADIHDPGLLRASAYPPKLIDHAAGRARALAAYAEAKAAARPAG